MKLLLVAATQAEINGVFDYFNLPDEPFVQTDSFDVLITGVGMVATAFTMGKIDSSNYNLVINLGIAGSFDRNIPLGTLVNIEQDIFAELGAEDHDKFIPINELGFGEISYTSTFEFANLPIVKAITVNKVHGDQASIDRIVKLFNPQTESMEGAAVFYACTQMNIPCLQIRAISNYVEPRNRANWEIGLAVKNLNKWAIDFVKTYTA
ncbi:MAG: futalosine hydrolase [Flavobacterium sp.]|nr:MAG: futalosine hydrolase [Flavobacterium sp.]